MTDYQAHYHTDGASAGHAPQEERGVSSRLSCRQFWPNSTSCSLRSLPGVDGLEATRQIAADPELGGVRIVILTNDDEIAQKLYMSPATVRTHVSRAMTKLGVRDRAQLVVLAYETGLVRPNWLI